LRGHHVTGMWFNPNIHPFVEYDQRLKSMKKLAQLWNIDMLYQGEYGLVDFLRTVVGKEDTRCRYCYFMRLNQTAREAAKNGFDAFTTTLLISPYQDLNTIAGIGQEVSEIHGIPFYYEDFRLGFKNAMATAKELDLYRQKYCGCIYSEMERYMKKKKSKSNKQIVKE
jgi:predicted adenine nucleotide alpha hydrolase (AANH) superfamily ATPase